MATKTYELLADVALDQKVDLKNSLFQSETRFANYASRIYSNMEQGLPLIISALEIIKLEKRDGNSEDRDKAKEAEELQLSLQNKKFAIVLCGLVDIYNKFGQIVENLQKVNTLPWQRLDLFNKHVKDLEKMLEILKKKENGHEQCKEETKREQEKDSKEKSGTEDKKNIKKTRILKKNVKKNMLQAVLKIKTMQSILKIEKVRGVQLSNYWGC